MLEAGAVSTALLIVVAAGLVAAWFVGSIVLRVMGWVLVVSAVVMMGTAVPGRIGAALVGVVLWLAGHGLYRTRHGGWRSRRLAKLPTWWDGRPGPIAEVRRQPVVVVRRRWWGGWEQV